MMEKPKRQLFFSKKFHLIVCIDHAYKVGVVQPFEEKVGNCYYCLQEKRP